MVLWKPGAHNDIFHRGCIRLEGEMESLDHFLRQPDLKRRREVEEGAGGGCRCF